MMPIKHFFEKPLFIR